MVTLTLVEGGAELALVVLNFLVRLSRWRELIPLQVVSVGLNIRRLSMRIQACRLARGPVRVHLLLVEHLHFLRILHVNRRAIVLRLLLALCIIVSGRILLLLAAIVGLVPHPLGAIEILSVLRLLRGAALFGDRLRRVLSVLALVDAVVDHGVIVALPLSVLDGRSHRHGRKMNPVAIFGLNLWHATLQLIDLGIVGRAVPRLDVAVVPTAPRRVLLRARSHELLLVLLQLLSRRELTVVVDGAASHTHYTVYVDRPMSVIHGVTFSPVHDVAILRPSRLVVCNA